MEFSYAGWAAMPVVFELDPGQTQEIKVTWRSGTVERSIQLLAVREFYWPNYHIPELPRKRVFRSAEVDLVVSGIRATLHARPFEMPQTVNGLRLYVETTRAWATEPQLHPMPEVRGAVRLSCVAEGAPWGPAELRFPIRNYRWRANTYGNTWLALVPYNKHYYHRGEDFGAIPDRLEVLASLEGVVRRSPLPDGDAGSNRLEIRTPSGLGLDYSHMNIETIAPHLTNGAAVSAGDLLGRTGMTWSGRKSQHNDPHLHWAVSFDGQPLASYPFVVEAYLRDYADPLLAVAGGYHYATPGETVELDASRSVARPGRRIFRYQWRLHDGREVAGPRATVKAGQPGLFSEELRLLADDGSEDRDYAQLRVWNTNSGARFAAGWFYHWPVRGARPGTPILFWNRLSGNTGPVEIDFGDDSKPARIDQEISHTYTKAGLYTAALRSRGPGDEPVEVRMRVVIEPAVADTAETVAVSADDFLSSIGVCSAVSRRGENLHPDYTPRVAATHLHNLTTILADQAAETKPGKLKYSIPNQPATVHDLLLQKSNGTFELVVWNERFTGGSDSVAVELGATYASVTLFDPTIGTSPIRTLTHVSSVGLTLSNHPVIIEIPQLKPSGGTESTVQRGAAKP